MAALRYLPYETVVDTAFWHGLADRKLNVYCLQEGPFPLRAEYVNSHALGIIPRMSVDVTAFEDSKINRVNCNQNVFEMKGLMLSYNSLDQFKKVDKQLLINQYGSKWMNESLENNEFLKDPAMLTQFLLINYCDLKKHKFYFWFAYPTVLHSVQPTVVKTRRFDEEFSDKHISQFLLSYDAWRNTHKSAFFIASLEGDSFMIKSCTDLDLKNPSVYLGMCDSSVDPSFPSWLLRNMLYAISAKLIKNEETLKVICFRDRYSQGDRQCKHSLVLYLQLSQVEPAALVQYVGWEKWKGSLRPRVVDMSSSMDPLKLSESAVDLNLKLMKWRLVPDLKLSSIRDTKCLLIGAGTLGCNVARQLLAWGVRHITFIDNGVVALSNPVRQSLFVFNDAIGVGRNKAEAAADALKSISPAVKAAGINLSIPMPGHPISTFSRSQQDGSDADGNKSERNPDSSDAIRKTCNELCELIHSHDVLFLLTDTRESRWLPSVLANIYGKLVINAALGFDTYLVIRHGLASAGVSPSFIDPNTLSSELSNTSLKSIKDKSSKSARSSSVKRIKSIIPGSKLGCYFCNDVVGPMNSTENRSLDQQCTVSRPGVSMIAAAIAVELLVNVLQHPLGTGAPADMSDKQDFSDSSISNDSLGIVPHQIRGFLSHFTQVLPATEAFTHCSACSQNVLDMFKRDGFDFLLRVFNDAAYLERISGLEELRSNTKDEEVLMLSDSE